MRTREYGSVLHGFAIQGFSKSRQIFEAGAMINNLIVGLALCLQWTNLAEARRDYAMPIRLWLNV
jgi:hypothetical protein